MRKNVNNLSDFDSSDFSEFNKSKCVFHFYQRPSKKVQFQGFIEYERDFFLVMIMTGNNNTKIYSQYQITWTLPHSDGSGLIAEC